MKLKTLLRVLLIIAVIAVSFSPGIFGIACFADILSDNITDELYGAIGSDSQKILDDNGISILGGTENIGIESIFSGIVGLITDEIKKPLTMFAVIMAVMLLSTLLSGFGESAGGNIKSTYMMVSAACAAVVVSAFLSDIISAASSVFNTAADFMLVYIPILAGVAAASGQAASAAVYGSAAVALIQILAKITSAMIIPLTGCMLGITAAGSVNPEMNLDRLCDGIKKIIIWGLGLVMTIFLGILSVQTAVTSAADSAALRTARFAVSSAVPIVGGAVSEALSTVYGSISLLRSGVGGFGIAAGAVMLAPPAVSALCYRFFLFVSGIISDILGCGEAGRMIRAGENVMAVVLAAISCFLSFITVSSAIVLVICRG